MSNSLTRKIENGFYEYVQKSRKVRNAHLLVDAERQGVSLKLAAGEDESGEASPDQPLYMASVGKLFTATVTGILVEQGQLSYEDSVVRHLGDRVSTLHMYKGWEHTEDITIRMLLNHTSGLYDVFPPMLKRLQKDSSASFSPKEAIDYGRKNLKTVAVPGKKFHYADTNYHLLGLIVEKVTGLPFPDVLRRHIFNPLGMDHSYFLHRSKPNDKPKDRLADFYLKNEPFTDVEGLAGIDYAGGGVVATLDDLLTFMKALTGGRIVKKETLDIMLTDTARFGLGIDYGHGLMKIKGAPLIIPKTFAMWGGIGSTGAFMFYHPSLEAYIIGNLNRHPLGPRGVRFAMFRVVRHLLKASRR